MHIFLNSCWLTQALCSLVRPIDLQNTSRDSGFATVLIITLVCVMIQPTTSSTILPTYSGILTPNSPMFSRPHGITGDYYYQTIELTVYTTGQYVFLSNSSMDIYGCFYNDPFNSSYPFQNLITVNDNGNAFGEFQITVRLQSGYTYVLVVTTFSSGVAGRFTITSFGSGSIHLTRFKPAPSNTLYISKTASIIVCGAILGVFTLLGGVLCVLKCRKNIRKFISPRHHQSVQPHDVLMADINRNPTRMNAIHVPHTVSMSTISETFQEQLPSSYESFISSLPADQQLQANRY